MMLNYALLENGIIVNVIWLYPQNAREFPNAVPMGSIPAGIGDSYVDGKFFRNGEALLSREEELQQYYDAMQEVIDSAT